MLDDYEDPEIEARWFAEQREVVLGYLRSEGVEHAGVEQTPAWSASPYVSLWHVESAIKPGAAGWWAICGDCPCDHVSKADASCPRDAVRAIASLWQEAALLMARGDQHPSFVMGSGDSDDELAPLLASRAELLLEWVDDDDAWLEDC